METISDRDADAKTDMDAALVRDPTADVVADAHQLCPIQSIAGHMGIARTGVKFVRSLPMDTKKMQPLSKLWVEIPTGAITSLNDKRVQ